jgi:hypothetical protein
MAVLGGQRPGKQTTPAHGRPGAEGDFGLHVSHAESYPIEQATLDSMPITYPTGRSTWCTTVTDGARHGQRPRHAQRRVRVHLTVRSPYTPRSSSRLSHRGRQP